LNEEERKRRAFQQLLLNAGRPLPFGPPTRTSAAPIMVRPPQPQPQQKPKDTRSNFAKFANFAATPFRGAADAIVNVTPGLKSANQNLLNQIQRQNEIDFRNAQIFNNATKASSPFKLNQQKVISELQSLSDPTNANNLKTIQTQVDKSRALGSLAQVASAPFLGSGRVAAGATGKLVSSKALPVASTAFRYGRNIAEGLGQGVASEFSDSTDPTLKGAITKGGFGAIVGGGAEPALGLVGKAFGKISAPVRKLLGRKGASEARALAQDATDTADLSSIRNLATESNQTVVKKELKRVLKDADEETINSLSDYVAKETDPDVIEAAVKATREHTAPKVSTKLDEESIKQGSIKRDIVNEDINKLQLGSDTEGRLSKKTVKKYADDIAKGKPIEPLVITRGDNGEVFVQDGKHRLEALKEMGVKEVPVAERTTTAERKAIQAGEEVPTNAPVAATEAATPSTSADLAQADITKIPDDIQQKIVNGEAITPEDLNRAMKVEGAVSAKKSEGFKGNLETTPFKNVQTAQEVVDALTEGKRITNKKTLEKAADKIAKNPSAAFADIVTKKQLISADDVATGNLLLREAIERGDVEAAIQIGTKMNIDGRKLGQAIQAYSTLKKTTPEGIVTYASKQALRAGKELDPETAGALIKEAERVAALPEGLEKAKATRDMLGQADSIGRDWKDTIQEVLSTPRAAMATADLSAPLRQGAVLGSRFPKEFAKASADSVKYFSNPKLFEQAMYDISQRPTYALMKKSKLAVTGAEGITGLEEQFMKNILETDVAKKLLVGHVVAASDRGYTGFLTKFRADVFDKIIQDSADAGVRLDDKAMDSLAKFINSASGRGSGKNLDRYGGLLSQALFSPKLWKSRIDVINPAYYARLDPIARKYALQSAASFGSIAFTVLGLAAMAGASVEWDARSADFAKIKVGNTRYDILGGLQQNLRIAAQLATGEKINSETGELQDLGPGRGFGKPSRADLVYQFIMNKANPIIGFGEKALRGTDPAGNPINLATEAGKLFIPLTAQGVYDTAKDQGSLPKGWAMNIPGTFGIGVQTYGAKPTTFGATGNSKAKDATKEQLEAAFGKTKVTVDGKPVDYLKLKDRKELAKSNPEVRKLYEREQEIERIFKSPTLRPEGISPESTQILNAYARRTANQKEDVFNNQKDAEYKFELAKYEEDKLGGEISRTDEIKRQKKLARLSVSSNWDKPVRDIYSLTLSDIKDLVAGDPNGEELFGQLKSLDNALFDAGIIKTHKFKEPKARTAGRGRSFARGASSSRGRSSSGPDTTKKRMGLEELLGSIKAAGFKVPDFDVTPQKRVFKVNLPSPAPRKARTKIRL
jgi:hypothetical protein